MATSGFSYSLYLNHLRNVRIRPARLASYSDRGMKKEEVARTLAREARLSDAAARDRVDEMVHQILKKLRQGKPVRLPGLGRLVSRQSSRSRQ